MLSIITDSTIARSGEVNANIVSQMIAAKITAAFPMGASSPPISPDSEYPAAKNRSFASDSANTAPVAIPAILPPLTIP